MFHVEILTLAGWQLDRSFECRSEAIRYVDEWTRAGCFVRIAASKQ